MDKLILPPEQPAVPPQPEASGNLEIPTAMDVDRWSGGPKKLISAKQPPENAHEKLKIARFQVILV